MPIAEICEAEGFSRVGLWTVNNSCSCKCPVDTCWQLARSLPCCDRTNNSGEWLPAESWEPNSVESDRNEYNIYNVSFKSCSCFKIKEWTLLFEIHEKLFINLVLVVANLQSKAVNDRNLCQHHVTLFPRYRYRYHKTWKNFFLYQSIPSRHESKEQWFEHRWDLRLSIPASRSESSKAN